MNRRAFLVSAAAWLSRAQDPQRYSIDVKVVNVLATVRNKQGEIVKDLAQDDFQLDEDGRRQSIRYFARQTDLPLKLGLLVDTSGSQRRLIEPERRASRTFLEQVLREDTDQAFLLQFNVDVELLQDLTGTRGMLINALEDLGVPARRRFGRRPPPSATRRRYGGTALYDSIVLAADELMRKRTGRKALVILTDGVDNGSHYTIGDAVESALQADTLVYSVLYADKEGYGRGSNRTHDGKKVLQQLARETGGGYYEVSARHPIESIYRRLEEELRNQYSLGYNSDRPAKAPEFRAIKLAAKKRGLIVQTRPGYYAGP